MLKIDGQTNTQSLIDTILCWNCSFNVTKTGKIEICLIFDNFRNDVITRVIKFNFLNFFINKNVKKNMIRHFN